MGRLRIGGNVERVDGRELTYKDFVERYMRPNLPVVLTGLMDGWSSCVDWVTPDGLPSLPFFSSNFGQSIVQVADCGTKEFTDQKRTEMTVKEYIDHWLGIADENCVSCLDSNKNSCSLLYLKDWHFVKEYPEYVAYTTPPFFIDDWLNQYLDSHFMHRSSDSCGTKNDVNCADYKFVYMGPKGTWTPLHADVFRSYSWSANVCGRKLWHLLPPSQSHLVFDRNLKNSVYDAYDKVSDVQFPDFKKTIWLECIQEQNEIIFVPSGWYHQVCNLEDTISINHNWFNAYNLAWVWDLLLKDYNEAKEYIEDIREISDDFEGLCQRNLAANTGMNFYDFFSMIKRFALANSMQLSRLKYEENAFAKSSNKHEQLVYNLLSIRAVALSMKSADAFAKENLKPNLVENHLAEILLEPEFIKLSMSWNQTYGMANVVLEQNYQSKIETSCLDGGIVGFLHDYSEFNVRCPEDLVKLVDRTISDHSSICNGCNLSLPYDTSNLGSRLFMIHIV
ncbi:putative transcription factor & chromatin remodeling &Metalloenzymes JmjC family [Dioscorea sansibarensis]